MRPRLGATAFLLDERDQLSRIGGPLTTVVPQSYADPIRFDSTRGMELCVTPGS